MKNKKFHISYRKVFFLSTISISISIILSLIAYGYSKYINLASQNIIKPPYDTYVTKINNYEKALSKYIPFNDYDSLKNTNLL
jgi:hypothetical protein